MEETRHHFRAFSRWRLGLDKWTLKDVNEIAKWDNRIAVIEQSPLFKDVSRDTSWSITARRFMDFNDENRISNSYHLRVWCLGNVLLYNTNGVCLFTLIQRFGHIYIVFANLSSRMSNELLTWKGMSHSWVLFSCVELPEAVKIVLGHDGAALMPLSLTENYHSFLPHITHGQRRWVLLAVPLWSLITFLRGSGRAGNLFLISPYDCWQPIRQFDRCLAPHDDSFDAIEC